MRPTKSDKTGARGRRAWQAPAVVKMPIGTETKSSSRQDAAKEPSQPAEPSSKLGFAFEMGFPLSARTEG